MKQPVGTRAQRKEALRIRIAMHQEMVVRLLKTDDQELASMYQASVDAGKRLLAIMEANDKPGRPVLP